MIAPKIEREYFLKMKNNTLTKNILNTPSKVGVLKNSIGY